MSSRSLTLAEYLEEAKATSEPTCFACPGAPAPHTPITRVLPWSQIGGMGSERSEGPVSRFPYYEALAALSGMPESDKCDKHHVKAVDKLMFAAHARHSEHITPALADYCGHWRKREKQQAFCGFGQTEAEWSFLYHAKGAIEDFEVGHAEKCQMLDKAFAHFRELETREPNRAKTELKDETVITPAAIPVVSALERVIHVRKNRWGNYVTDDTLFAINRDTALVYGLQTPDGTIAALTADDRARCKNMGLACVAEVL